MQQNPVGTFTGFRIGQLSRRRKRLLFMVVYEVDASAARLEHEPIQLIGDQLGKHYASAKVTSVEITKMDSGITKAGSSSKAYACVRFDSSRSGGDETKTADKFIALFELHSVEGSAVHCETISNDSEWLAFLIKSLQMSRIVSMEFVDSYELIASLHTGNFAC